MLGEREERPAPSWPRVSLRDTEVREHTSLFRSMVRITYPFANGPVATQTEAVSVLSAVGTSRKLTRNSTGKKMPVAGPLNGLQPEEHL